VDATDRFAIGCQIEDMTIYTFLFEHFLPATDPESRFDHRKLHLSLRAWGIVHVRPLYLDIDHAEQRYNRLQLLQTFTPNHYQRLIEGFSFGMGFGSRGEGFWADQKSLLVIEEMK